jgi:thiamine biosynthesis lipoprotein
MLGTLVDVGIAGESPAQAIDAAFAAVAEVQACLSRFEVDSDVSRFHALAAGEWLAVRPHTAAVLAAAQSLHESSGGLFDVSLGSAIDGWHCEGTRLRKHAAQVRLDLGGIAKGYAVDRAVDALIANGCRSGWVNAGGDLRVFGDAQVPLSLRDETTGGVRSIGTIGDASFATSHFDATSRSVACGGPSATPVRAHASVAAPLCLWADALTKIVALSGNPSHPLLARHGARGWLH